MSKPQIFVKGYPVETTQNQLSQYFNRIGKVQQIRLMSHFAFLTFSSMHYAEKAVQKLDGKRFNGKKLLIQIARQSHDNNREGSSISRNTCFLCKKEGHWKINCPEFKSKIDPRSFRRQRQRQQSQNRIQRSRKYSQSSSSQQKKKKSKPKQKERQRSYSKSSSSSSYSSNNKSNSSSSSEQKRTRKQSKSKKHKKSKSHKKQKSHKNLKKKNKHHKKHSSSKKYSSSFSSEQSNRSQQKQKRSSSAASSHQKKYNKKVNNYQRSENKFSKYGQQKKINNRIGQKTSTPEKKKQNEPSKSLSNQKNISF